MRPMFPKAVRNNGRVYFLKSQVEDYKAALAGLPPKEFEGPDIFLTAKQLALELGVGRRTVGRRIVEAEASSAA